MDIIFQIIKKRLPSSLLENIKFYILPVYRKSKELIKPINGNGNLIDRKGALIKSTRSTINGNNNRISLQYNAKISKCTFTISGDHNSVIIETGARIDGVAFVITSNDCTIRIGQRTRIYNNTHIAAIEDNSHVSIGNDCLISSNVDIRTGDSHSVIDVKTGNRTNFAKNIFIGDHVWIGAKVDILKGSHIHDNCIIGMKSIVTKTIPANSIAVGNPARLVKSDVVWIDQIIPSK